MKTPKYAHILIQQVTNNRFFEKKREKLNIMEKEYKEIKIAKEQYSENYRQSKDELFGLVKDEEGKIHITMGQYIASQKTFDTFDQAEQYIGTKPYELIYNIILIVTHYEKEMQMASKVTKDSQKN